MQCRHDFQKVRPLELPFHPEIENKLCKVFNPLKPQKAFSFKNIFSYLHNVDSVDFLGKAVFTFTGKQKVV